MFRPSEFPGMSKLHLSDRLLRPGLDSAVFAGCLGLCLAATPASALVSHAWVSNHGNDVATCGDQASPCRTFQYAATAIVGSGGEIDVLDPGAYGPIAILHALHIVNDGVGTAAVYQPIAGANAITISAGPADIVVLKGLTISGAAGGANGIQFNTGDKLEISNSSVRDFRGVGLNFRPNIGAGKVATLTTIGGEIGDNGTADVVLQPVGGTRAQAALLGGCNIGNAPVGVSLDATLSAIGMADATISNCDLHDLTSGAVAQRATGEASLMVEHTNISAVTNALTANGAKGSITLNASTLSWITTVASVANGGVVNSFGDNGIYYASTLGPMTSVPLK
jgi:hypothetical protein